MDDDTRLLLVLGDDHTDADAADPLPAVDDDFIDGDDDVFYETEPVARQLHSTRAALQLVRLFLYTPSQTQFALVYSFHARIQRAL